MRPFVLLAIGCLLLAGPLPSWGGCSRQDVAVPTKATAAVYVYEKDASPVPVGVTVGLNRLNRERNVIATLLEADTTDGDGDVPDQYKPALAAARGRGLPCLVVLSGPTVLAIVDAPSDADKIVRAVP